MAFITVSGCHRLPLSLTIAPSPQLPIHMNFLILKYPINTIFVKRLLLLPILHLLHLLLGPHQLPAKKPEAMRIGGRELSIKRSRLASSRLLFPMWSDLSYILVSRNLFSCNSKFYTEKWMPLFDSIRNFIISYLLL